MTGGHFDRSTGNNAEATTTRFPPFTNDLLLLSVVVSILLMRGKGRRLFPLLFEIIFCLFKKYTACYAQADLNANVSQ
jgi:hypothetical protein